MTTITWTEFEKVDLRSGTIVKVEEFSRAKKPAYKVWADFGKDIGVLQTSAQITHHYNPSDLIGKSIIGCINLGEKNIAGFISQFLLIGIPDDKQHISLLTMMPNVPNGNKVC